MKNVIGNGVEVTVTPWSIRLYVCEYDPRALETMI